MSRFALVVDGVVAEIICEAEGLPPIAERYHPDIVAQLVPAPDEAEAGWRVSWESEGIPAAWVLPARITVDLAAMAASARARRAELLLASDHTQLMDSPLTKAQRAAWAAYRKALREVPDQAGFPSAVIWPEAPSA